MTFRAELNARGQDIYGVDSFILYPRDTERAVFDPDAEGVFAGVVSIPQALETAAKTRNVRRELRLLTHDTYTETHFTRHDGKWRNEGASLHHGIDLGGDGLRVALPGIPGLEDGFPVTARIVYERDFPLISRVKRAADNISRILRLEQYHSRQRNA